MPLLAFFGVRIRGDGVEDVDEVDQSLETPPYAQNADTTILVVSHFPFRLWSDSVKRCDKVVYTLSPYESTLIHGVAAGVAGCKVTPYPCGGGHVPDTSTATVRVS